MDPIVAELCVCAIFAAYEEEVARHIESYDVIRMRANEGTMAELQATIGRRNLRLLAVIDGLIESAEGHRPRVPTRIAHTLDYLREAVRYRPAW